MKLVTSDRTPAQEASPYLVLLAFEGEKPELPPGLSIPPAAVSDFKGRFRQTVLAYPQGKAACERVALVGLGKKEKVGCEEVRRVAALACAGAKDKGAAELAIAFPRALVEKLGEEPVGRAFAEGAILGGYKFDKLKTKKKEDGAKAPEKLVLFARGRDFERGLEYGARAARAANFARELEDSPANHATPTHLANAARKLAGGRVSCRIFDAADLERLGLGALLAVAQGSREPAKMIVLHYKPKKKAKETIAIVGKGLTFDSGGISIKPSAAMDEMKYDMCGGGAVLGAFHALREMDLPIEVIGVVPSTENLPGGRAYKPSDVIVACDGTTIEVLNTDAEGRIILCDAIAWVEKHHGPDVIVDLATLTGAIVVALGHEMTGVFANDDGLQKAICEAGERAGERCWPMPLWDVHKDQVKSEIADLKNINSPKDGGGAIAGAAFLAHFVSKAQWAHLDIAGTAWGGRERDYLHASGAAGVGVRLLLQFLHDRASE